MMLWWEGQQFWASPTFRTILEQEAPTILLFDSLYLIEKTSAKTMQLIVQDLLPFLHVWRTLSQRYFVDLGRPSPKLGMMFWPTALHYSSGAMHDENLRLLEAIHGVIMFNFLTLCSRSFAARPGNIETDNTHPDPVVSEAAADMILQRLCGAK